MASPSNILEELLRFRLASDEETADLINFNHDDLCNRVISIINTLLDSFEKYEHISYITQGPRDYGVDVLLKHTKADEPERYIGFQIKSYREIEDKDGSLSKSLKVGLHDAKTMYGDNLLRYYILLFGHAKNHFKRITAINNEFTKDDIVRVISPRHLKTFIEFPTTTVSAIVDRYLCEEDYVRQQARNEVFGYSEHELRLIINCLSFAFENSTNQIPLNYINNLKIDEDVASSRMESFNELNDTDFEFSANSQGIRIRTENFPAIRALYFDLQVRYQETPNELIEHLIEFLHI